MEDVVFEMKTVTEKRKRAVKVYKGRPSIYDPVIDKFLESEDQLVEITFTNKPVTTAAATLQKRIEKRELNLLVSTVDNYLYLEKASEEA